MPRGYPKDGLPRQRLGRKFDTTGLSALKRVYSSNHYKEKGMDFDLFCNMVKQDCHYCGAPPALTNPFGSIYKISPSNRHGSARWHAAQSIPFNGIDKIVPTDDYRDAANLVPCLKICNFFKHKMDYYKFLAHIGKIYNHIREKHNEY